MRQLKIFILLLSVVSASPVYAEADSDTSSGSYFLRACSYFLGDKSSDTYVQTFDSGECSGAVQMLRYTSRRNAGVCYPQQATSGQIARVIVKYLNDHPEKLHEDYRVLSVEALQKAWPCINK
jgi:hypothetical protein